MGGSLPDIDNRTPRNTGPCSYEERGGRETLVGALGTKEGLASVEGHRESLGSKRWPSGGIAL